MAGRLYHAIMDTRYTEQQVIIFLNCTDSSTKNNSEKKIPHKKLETYQ